MWVATKTGKDSFPNPEKELPFVFLISMLPQNTSRPLEFRESVFGWPFLHWDCVISSAYVLSAGFLCQGVSQRARAGAASRVQKCRVLHHDTQAADTRSPQWHRCCVIGQWGHPSHCTSLKTLVWDARAAAKHISISNCQRQSILQVLQPCNTICPAPCLCAYSQTFY